MAGPTIASKAPGSAVCSLGAVRFSAPGSDVAEGAAADSFAVNRSLPLGAAFGSPTCCQALEDSRFGSIGISPAPGLALGCCSVWVGRATSVVCLALRQTCSSVITEANKLQ